MKEQMRVDLIERYLSTGLVGFTKPKDDSEAIDLIETVIAMYDEKPVSMSLSEITAKYKAILDF